METKTTWNKIKHNRTVKIITDENVLIAELDSTDMHFVCPTHAGIEKNAALISAAPELLEALEMLIEETEDYVNETACGNTYFEIAREKAMIAIKKATS